jgi:hypothetical protein
MIFAKTHEQVMSGTKTQTRRVVIGKGYIAETDDGTLFRLDNTISRRILRETQAPIVAIYTEKNGKRRLLYQVGNDYAIVPGRGKAQVGRFKLLSMRLELVQDITEGGVIKEGLRTVYDFDGHNRGSLWATFGALWDSLHKDTRNSWVYNPDVLVMGIEVVV